MPLAEALKGSWDHIQGFLFPLLHEEVGPLTENHRRLVMVLEVARPEAFVGAWRGGVGRRLDDRRAIARAFVAKVVFGLSTTSGLIDRLFVDDTAPAVWLGALVAGAERGDVRAPSPRSPAAGCRPACMKR
jgi:hypothetical protein